MFSPLSWAIVLLLILLLTWRRLPRALRFCGVGLEVCLLLLMAPVGANALVRVIEARVPEHACTNPRPEAVVVLSGGLDREPASNTDFGALNGESMHRLLTAVELWRRTPGALLVIAGGGPYRIPESALLAQLAQQLGVPFATIRTEQQSRSTWQNAHNLALQSPSLPKRIWLVTSSLHLPRALGAFRAFGFQPCAWSSGSQYVAFDGPGYFLPQSSSLDKAESAIHEWLGGLEYGWRHGTEPASN